MAQEKDPRKTSPHHGSEAGSDADQHPQQHESVSQADGTAANAPRGETEAGLRSQTPEGREGKLNPSAPNDGTSSMPANTTRDSAGEIGEPTGRGTLDAPKESTPTASNSEDEVTREKEEQRQDKQDEAA